MGLYKTTFPNKIGHGTTLGRSFRRLRVPTKMLWASGCQIYHSFLEWIGLYTHFDKQSFKNPKKKHPSKFWFGKLMFPKKYKDQNDRNAKSYRFITSPDHFLLKEQLKQRDWEKTGFHHASLFLTLSYGEIGNKCEISIYSCVSLTPVRLFLGRNLFVLFSSLGSGLGHFWQGPWVSF